MKWKNLRKLISDTIKISQDVIDFLSCYDILLLCASGKSNDYISRHLDVRVSGVQEAIRTYMSPFMIDSSWIGNDSDLNFNPYYLYKKLWRDLDRSPSFEEFREYVMDITGNLVDDVIYDLIVVFDTLRYTYLTKYRLEEERKNDKGL